MQILFRILAIVLGMVAGGAVVAGVEAISGLMYPMPEGLSMNDRQGMREWIAGLPTGAFLMLLVAWSAGCLVGAFVARRVSPGRSAIPGAVVCGLLTAATIFNLAMLPHPWWMWPAGILACLFFGLLGLVLAAPAEYTVRSTKNIQAPMERVFQTLSRVENFSKAVSGITNIEFLSEQHHGEGTRFRETRVMNGREASTILEVTEQVENERIRMVSDAGGTIWDTLFTVRQSGSSIQMDMQMDARPYNLMAKLMVPMIMGIVSKAVDSDMDAVKAYCEAS